MKNLFLTILFFSSFFQQANGQKASKKGKLYFKSGAGAVYSFFETDLPPFPFTNFNDFTIRKTVGRLYDFEAGCFLKKGFSLSVRYSDHKFSKKFDVQDTIINTNYVYRFAGKLYRNQYYWQLLLNKILIKSKNNFLGAGSGILFVNDGEQSSTKYSGVSNISFPSASFHEYRSWEFGIPVAIFYERKLKHNVSIGLKAQAYILISVGSFESISVNPYLAIGL